MAWSCDPVRKLLSIDQTDGFDCGQPALNQYLQWEFEPSVTGPLHLFLLMKDIKAMVAGSLG